VPIEVREPTLAVWRLGPNSQVWDQRATQVATIWQDSDSDGWWRAEWPQDPYGSPIAPLDLCVGHTLELRAIDATRAGYASVVAVQAGALVAVLSHDRDCATRISRQLHDNWRNGRLQDALAQFGTP
jgi:hypothetical protein